jgi:hypothetical protein
MHIAFAFRWDLALGWKILPAALAALLLICLKLRSAIQLQAALITLSGIAVCYAAEIFLTRSQIPPSTAARRMGRPYDSRSMFEVVEDLKKRGVDAYPAVLPNALYTLRGRGLLINGIEILPLGGVADCETVYCNESGQFVTYHSDEYGFNNPKGIWTLGCLDVAVLGDSYAQGACVAQDRNIVALLRQRYPATLNLGMGGNGPLLELAGLKEFLPNLKPRIVLWLFYENDRANLEKEVTSSLLRHYLEPSFQQGLVAKRDIVDQKLKETVIERARVAKRWPLWMSSIDLGRNKFPLWMQDVIMGGDATWAARVLRLARLHSYIGYSANRTVKRSQAPDIDRLLRRILEEARNTVASWGGRLYFVFIPSYRLLKHPGAPPLRNAVLELAQSLGIATIDLYSVFQVQPAPLTLFPYPYAHYNEKGYGLAAKGILDYLDAEDFGRTHHK